MKVVLTAQGQTLDDLMDALREASKRLADGNVLGFDRNESGSFHFEVKED